MSIIYKAAEYLKAYFTIKAMEEIKETTGEELKSYFNGIDDKSMVLQDNDGNNYKLSLVSTSRVSYDGEKLFTKIKDKKVRNNIVHNEATILDWDSFKNIMTKYQVPVNEVVDLLKIEKKVDKNNFQKAVEIGDLDLKDVADCYTIKTTDYLKVNTMK